MKLPSFFSTFQSFFKLAAPLQKSMTYNLFLFFLEGESAAHIHKWIVDVYAKAALDVVWRQASSINDRQKEETDLSDRSQSGRYITAVNKDKAK